MSVARHPKFCSSDDAYVAAAAEARPDVYKTDGTMSWASVASGWNTGCGDIPSNFTELSKKYAAETGSWKIIEDDSGFKANAWTPLNFKVWKVKSVGSIDGYAYGERPQAVENVASIFSINLFWLPTATSEIVGWMALQYEVCAYFSDPSGAVPHVRLYKTTESPLGASDPFVQVFHKTEGKTVEYRAVSPGYNDDGDAVGAAKFVSEETEGCAVWSEAENSRGILAIIIVLSVVFALVLLGLGFVAWRGLLHRTVVAPVIS